MGRSKVLLTEEIVFKAEKELSKIKDAKIVRKLLAILAFKDYKLKEVTKIFKISTPTLFSWIKRFEERGIGGLKEGRGGKYKGKLSKESWEEVKEMILKEEGINWTIEKIRLRIEKKYGIRYSLSTLHYNLRKLGLVLRRPRPVHYKGEESLKESFKKNERESGVK